MFLDEVIVENLTRAMAIALSPVAIVAIIMILLSGRARVNGIAFLLGWMTALIVNVTLFIFLYGNEHSGVHHKHIFVVRITDGILGVVLLYVAYLHWKLRPKHGVKSETPKFMQSIETFTPMKSFLFAALVISVNSKNTLLDIATGINIAQSVLSLFQTAAVILTYTFVASLTIIIPVLIFLFMGNRIQDKLHQLKKWLVHHSATILSVIFLIIGCHLLLSAFGY